MVGTSELPVLAAAVVLIGLHLGTYVVAFRHRPSFGNSSTIFSYYVRHMALRFRPEAGASCTEAVLKKDITLHPPELTHVMSRRQVEGYLGATGFRLRTPLTDR